MRAVEIAETREVARNWRRSINQRLASTGVLATGEESLFFPFLAFVIIGSEIEGVVGVVFCVPFILVVIIIIEVVFIVLIIFVVIGEEVIVIPVFREEFGIEIVVFVIVI